MELTFAQQIWLAVVDKLALGAALVGVGFVANKYLESHKVRQAFAAEVARQRLAAITDVWRALGEYEMEAYRAAGEGFLAILKELGAAGAKLPDPLPRDAQQILALVSTAKATTVLTDEAVARVNDWIAIKAAEMHPKSDRVVDLIASQRFLVGNDLAATFQNYHESIHRTFRKLGPSPAEMASYRESYQELKQQRSDIEATSKSVFG
ncbi:MAG TPA: hypothetical protein VGJ96_02370 [Gemmatimonadaceae bacterium]